jgi:beta-glucanase (GH16 family)
VTAKLPNTKYLWPAIWFCGTQSWPPELDLMEAYNNGHIQYASSNNIICQPNIHFRENGENKALFPGSKYVSHPDERYVTYTLHWEEDFVRFYYDDYLVFECTDKKILDQMNQPMSLILDNAVEMNVKLSQKDIDKLRTGDNWFYVKNIKYYDKKRVVNKYTL